MRIELNSGGLGGISTISNMQENINKFIQKSETLVSALKSIKSYTYNISGGVGSLQYALGEVESRINTEEQKQTNLGEISTKINSFIELAHSADLNVSKLVDKNKQEFYGTNSWAKLLQNVLEKSFFGKAWDRLCETGKAIDDAVKKILESIKDFYKSIKTIVIEYRKNDFYKKLSDEDKANVEKYVDTMEEPYKSIYLNNYLKYDIGNTSGKNTGFYNSNTNLINVDMSEEPNNPRGPYVTFFHESGHAIDYNYNNDGNYYSMTYRNAEGKSLQDVIYEDVKNNIQESVSNYVSDEATNKRIVDYLMGARTIPEDSLTNTERAIVSQIQSDYITKLNTAVNEAPSDVFGGVTNNLIIGDYGHRPDESEGETYDTYDYWYDTSGNATYAQSRELWAEYYSYCATGDIDNLEALSKYFPKSKAFLDEMSESMQR